VNPQNRTEHSGFLTQIEQRYGTQLASLTKNDGAALEALIAETRSLDLSDNFAQALRRCKALFSYRWGLARVTQSLPADQLGHLQTAFAECSINAALRSCWAMPQFAKLLPNDIATIRSDVPGLFILGLGKLGGYDLNFSSDVDLIAFYDVERLPIAAVHGRSDVCHRVLQTLTQLLSKTVEGEFVWRVDWRLRPNASTMSLCMSTEIAEDFYFFHSQPWQRLAMIKARTIAGDINAGKQFLVTLEPYLWRQNLDFQMIDDIHRLKNKINLEHPQLKQSRDSGQLHELTQSDGFNLKLGRGGIREIEFIVNATQLLWAGKKPALRQTATTKLLSAILEVQLISFEDHENLLAAYTYLRWLEDTAQIQDNFQTHKLPVEPKQLSDYLALVGIESHQEIQTTLAKHRQNVADIFDTLFKQSGNATFDEETALDHEPDWVETLPERQKSLFMAWANGFAIYSVTPEQSETLAPLYTSLCKLLSDSGINRVAAIDKIHAFFNTIPKGPQYLRLLAQQPALLKNIVDPLIYSPHMTQLLEQSPHIVDYLLEPNSEPDRSTTFDSNFVIQTDDFEQQLERLRRFVNEQLYAACLQLLNGDIGAIALQQRLTALAVHSLTLGITITNKAMSLNESPIAIIGMGKLGMAAMAPMSDLDLIFVSCDNVELELANRYSQRLQHLMALRTREGRAYEMDMRLRPSGNSGPVTVSLKGFSHYQHNRAKTWEHIALCAGQSIAGATDLQQQISTVRSDVLSRPRNKQQLALDAAKMLWRLQSQRIGKSAKPGIDVKLRPGGLMELDYLCACICLLIEPDQKATLLSYDEMVLSCAKRGLSEASFARYKSMIPTTNTITEATQFWRKLQIWGRIFGLDEQPIEQLKPDLAEKLLFDMQLPSMQALSEKIHSISESIHLHTAQMQKLFEQDKPHDWEDWVETPVQWLH
jgi:glutamate-ammonia-ligase adenylyltransferase